MCLREGSPCLVDIVFVHSCIKSFVNEVKHLKEVKWSASPREVVEAVNLREEDQIQRQIQIKYKYR